MVMVEVVVVVEVEVVSCEGGLDSVNGRRI